MVKTNWNQGWQFSKDSISVEGGASVLKQGSWEAVNLPHTWNGMDGQDGATIIIGEPAVM